MVGFMEPTRPDEHRSTKAESLFDDTPKRKIKRSGSSAQKRILIGTILAVAAAVVLVSMLVGKPTEVPVLKGWKATTAFLGVWKEDRELTAVVEFESSFAVSAPEEGIIAPLNVEEGGYVKKGQVVARLIPDTLQTKRIAAANDVETAKTAIQKLDADHVYAIQTAKQNRPALVRTLEEANRALELQTRLAAVGGAGADDVRTARNTQITASEKLEAADAEAAQTEKLYGINRHADEVALKTAQDTLADYDKRIAACTVRSPTDGRILTIESNTREAGLLIEQYATLLTIADTAHPLLKGKLTENDSPLVRKGMPVTITQGSGSYEGAVDRIGVVANTDSDTYGTYVYLYARPRGLSGDVRSGASGTIKINLGERKNVIMVARGPWYTGTGQDYVYVMQGDSAAKRKVAFGASGVQDMEVLSGLKPGEKIISCSYQTFAGKESVKLDGKSTSDAAGS